MEINARLLPLALHGTLGHTAHIGDLCKGKSAEKLQVHNLDDGLSTLASSSKAWPMRVSSRSSVIFSPTSVVESSDFELSTSLDCQTVSYVVDNQSAHHPSSIPP